MKIGKYDLKEKPFIIAEVGSNWKTREHIFDAPVMAAKAGASAVKFQMFDHESMYGYPGEMTGSLPPEHLPRLKNICDRVGIELVISCFHEKFVDLIEPHVNCHKIASSEAVNLKLLEKVRDSSKPILLSLGAVGVDGAKASMDILGKDRTIPMYCEAEYPAHRTDPRMIDRIRHILSCDLVGFSDHSTDFWFIPMTAVHGNKACVLEKHVSFIVDTDTPDAPHSLNFDLFKLMCFGIETKKLVFMPSPDMVSMHAKRLVACKPIKAKEFLKYGDNFGAFRSKTPMFKAIWPLDLAKVDGTQAIKDFNVGDAIEV